MKPIEIDLSPESKCPCKELMLTYLECAKIVKPEEKRPLCSKWGHAYFDCRRERKFKMITKDKLLEEYKEFAEERKKLQSENAAQK